jgi:tripartite-type tricarboxylate transporter receptor subunit TctC
MRHGTITILLAAACALTAGGTRASAQAFPTRPVTFIVPWSVGGTYDVQLRALGAATEKHLGQPIVMENRSSTTGTLGPAQMAATAKPDGYTVTQIGTSVLRLPFIARTTYDPATDFTYIIGISGLTAGVVVRNDAPWKTFGEFLAHAAANPGKINYGAPSGAANPYVVMRLIGKQRNIEWTHVPFKSTAESSNALMGGHIHAISDAAGWAPYVNSGQFRLLATFGSSRTKNWPGVPTLTEHGIDVVANSAYGIAGPRGMDPAVVRTLHDAFKKGMEDPFFVNVLSKFEQEPIYQSTEDYRAYVMREIIAQKEIVEQLGLKE